MSRDGHEKPLDEQGGHHDRNHGHHVSIRATQAGGTERTRNMKRWINRTEAMQETGACPVTDALLREACRLDAGELERLLDDRISASIWHMTGRRLKCVRHIHKQSYPMEGWEDD